LNEQRLSKIFMAKIEKDLQELILSLPQKEKDKMLLRLVAKDEKLVKKLEYELLESGSTLESRKQTIRKEIDNLYKMSHYSSGYLMMDMRYVNARIAEHVKTTTDKYGEVELTLQLLCDCFRKQLEWVSTYSSKSDTIALYIAKRTDIIYKKVVKMHPDIQFDFFKELNYLLECIHQYAPMPYAREMKIPKTFEIKE
jgi:hypothetical protein